MSEKQKKKALFGVFAVVLCDIVSLGMIVPLTPILAREFGAGGLKVGLLISSYSIAQFLFAPFWGRLSDVFGRKAIIFTGLCGSSLAYAVFAFSDSFAGLFVSRALSGFFACNVAVATASIADLTSAKNRSKNMGLIGLAFGAGFTAGPILGFSLMFLGERLGAAPPFGANFSALGASFLALANSFMSLLFLKESLISGKRLSRRILRRGFFLKQSLSKAFQKNRESSFARPSLWLIIESLKTPKLGAVLFMSFLLWLALAQIEPVLILFVQDDFEWGAKTAYSSFIYVGFLMALSQGYLIRKWIPKWGERALNQSGLLTASLGLGAIALSGLLPFAPSVFFSLAFFVLFLGVTLFSVGHSLSSASLNGALSLLSSEKEQGSLFGVQQSLSAMARIIGPAMGGWLYQNFSHESPFLMGGLFSLLALALAFRAKKYFPSAGRAAKNKFP